MSNTVADIVVRITHAGLLAASRNPPDRNGFKIEIHQAKAYDGAGLLRGTYPTTGYRLNDGTVRVSVMIGVSNLSNFDLHRIDLIDKTSDVVFAQVRREDHSVIDEVFGKKKTMLNYYLKLGLIDDQNIEITVSGDDESLMAMKYLDDHILDKDAHSVPDTITATTENDTVGGKHTHQIDLGTVDTKGLVRFASLQEAIAGTDTDSAVTPAGLQAKFDTIPSVAEATVDTLGVVKLASAEDIANGTPGKVVTADALQFINRVDVVLGAVSIINSSSHKADVTFKVPFDSKKIMVRGFLDSARGNIEQTTTYTVRLKNRAGALLDSYTRTLRGNRSGGSGHGYYHSWYVPLDSLKVAANIANLGVIDGQKKFVASDEYTLEISSSNGSSNFNISEAMVTIDCYG